MTDRSTPLFRTPSGSMTAIHAYGLFLLASVVVNLTPGQDTLYILGRSVIGGRRAGTAAALGIGAGNRCPTDLYHVRGILKIGRDGEI